MDPSVAPLEALLDALAQREVLDGRVRAEHAFFVCSCATEHDAPSWLAYDDASGAVHWFRVPDRFDLPDRVEAPHVGGIHAAPEDVLAWLRGTSAGPAQLDFGWGEEALVRRLVERLRPA